MSSSAMLSCNWSCRAWKNGIPAVFQSMSFCLQYFSLQHAVQVSLTRDRTLERAFYIDLCVLQDPSELEAQRHQPRWHLHLVVLPAEVAVGQGAVEHGGVVMVLSPSS